MRARVCKKRKGENLTEAKPYFYQKDDSFDHYGYVHEGNASKSTAEVYHHYYFPELREFAEASLLLPGEEEIGNNSNCAYD